MANPVGFPYANQVFRAPEGMSQEECGDLQTFSDGKEVISCWRLSPEELAMINETGCVWLSVLWPKTPPVRISGHSFLLAPDGTPVKPEPYIPPAPRTKG